MNTRKRKTLIKIIINTIINEIEDKEEEDIMLQLAVEDMVFKKRRKRVSIKNYVESIVPILDDFQAHFRLKRSTVENLIKMIGPRLKLNINTVGRPSGDIQKILLVFLWMAANNCVYRILSERFDIAMSTAWEYFRQICNVLVDISPTFIQWPTGCRATAVIKGFRDKKGFINVIGAIDGTHIEICKPKENGESFFNRKKRYAIQAQVVCDHTRIFTDVFVGYPGSVHDARVFTNSDIRKKIIKGEISFTRDSHLLGDSAYGNCNYLLVPYKDDGFLNDIKKNYNYIHSATRVVIEQAIGLWKGRFRILRYLNVYNTEDIPNIILALAVLHNICLSMGDDDVESFVEDTSHSIDISEQTDVPGNIKRDQIATYLFNKKSC